MLLPALFALAACAQPEIAPDALLQPQLPEAFYADAARRGEPVYRIRAGESVVLVRVGRSGTLKNLGHDHVIASEDVEGLILLSENPANSRVDLLIPLQRLIVDKPEHRRKVGLEAVPDSAIEGTTRNMQDKVLESATYPWAQVGARLATTGADPTELTLSMTLHGTAHDYLIPVDLRAEADKLSATGRMSIQHADFGLTPFSAAGGLLRVAEQLDLEFSIVAYRTVSGR